MKTFEHSGVPLIREESRHGVVVNIVRGICDEDPEWGDTWVPEMGEWIGKKAVIVRVFRNKVRLQLVEDFIKRSFNFPYFVLENTGEIVEDIEDNVEEIILDDLDLEPVRR